MPDRALVLTADHSPSGAVVLRLTGELDHLTAARFRRAVEEIPLRAESPLVLDMTLLTFCDSVGLTELVLAHRRARAARTSVLLVGVSRELGHLLALTGVDRVLTAEEGPYRAPGPGG
ncbi:STAS domain-containing protein [Streptomyces sp. NPDC057287]|uniref:STAS domain-containing protein n=1 Tax=Streptomyces sp. NPDC057287 TaxID=3346086 RepID=UPI0036275CA8